MVAPATGLLTVFNDLTTFDLDNTSRTTVLKLFGDRIVARAGAVSVQFAVADDPDSCDATVEYPDVTVISVPGGDVRLAGRNESWWSGRLAPNGTAYRHLVETGDNVSLTIPLGFTSCIGAMRVVAPKSVLIDPDQWATVLFALTETLSARRRMVKRQARQAFYQDLMAVATYYDPTATSPRVCELWQKFSGADWVWLWLQNPYSRRFELAAFHRNPPPPGFTPGETSAAAYAVETGRVVMASGDLSRWVKRHADKTYRLMYTALLQNGDDCKAVISVPLVFDHPAPQGSQGDTSPRVRGVVCLHYNTPDTDPPQPRDSLLLMGRQSAQVIGNAYLEDQRRILVSLNEIAQRHLTRVSGRPDQVRREYLDELIGLIQHSLHFQTVSIFYRRPFNEAVECVATTGVETPKTKLQIPPDRLGEVVYTKGQGRTGLCFQTGKELIIDRSDNQDHTPTAVDIDPRTGERVKGLVFQPILTHDVGTTTVIGVIRCGKYEDPAIRIAKDGVSSSVSFHPVHVRTLSFIAQQVGLVLQIFEKNIHRERIISTVKHDLFTNNNIIRDASERLERDHESGQSIRVYDIKNLSVSHLMSANLIAQLDAEPGVKDPYNPEPTHLVGNILARVVHMLGHYAAESMRMTIEFDKNIESVLPTLRIDRALVERVMHNLIVNAVKYGKPETEIRISARRSEKPDGYCVDFANHGIGIGDEDAGLIGQPHYRCEGAKRVAQGLGLGIYIARKSMERHGGDLILKRRRNPTVFSMFFPKHLAAGTEDSK